MRQRASLVLIGIMELTAAACIFPRGAEGPVQTYVLQTDAGAWKEVHEKQEQHGVLLIAQPQAEPGFDTARMAYITRPFEVKYYASNQWADTPARMMLPLIVEKLERSGVWQAVAPAPTVIKADVRLDTQGLMIQQEFVERPSRSRVTLRLQLVDLREQRVIGTSRFEAIEPSQTEDAYGGVTAANRAVKKLLDEVSQWVNRCLNRNRQDHC